jgi:hypothetical protein
MMTISLTLLTIGTRHFSRVDTRRPRASAWSAFLATTVLFALAAPASACDKAAAMMAAASGETRAMATFTGELVNGAPVYRLPAITVVGRRPANVANTQRDEVLRRNSRVRGDAAAAAPAPTSAANAADKVTAMKPCVG